MRKKITCAVQSSFLTPYRWSFAIERYSLNISVNVSHLTEKRKKQIRNQRQKIDNFFNSLTVDDCFNIIQLYKTFTRMIFTKHELQKCKKVEIYLLYFSDTQATTDISKVCRTEAKSRIVTQYGLLKELCLYEPENDELYHVYSNRNWLWKTNKYQLRYSHKNNKKTLICDANCRPDNPQVLEDYVQPSINDILKYLDTFI